MWECNNPWLCQRMGGSFPTTLLPYTCLGRKYQDLQHNLVTFTHQDSFPCSSLSLCDQKDKKSESAVVIGLLWLSPLSASPAAPGIFQSEDVTLTLPSSVLLQTALC